MNTAFKQSVLSHIAGLFNGGTLVIGKGTVPSPDAAIDSSSVIATLNIPANALGVAGTTLQLNAGLQGTASSAGTASFFRLVSPDGAVVWQGPVSAGSTPVSGRLVLNNTTFVQGQAVTITLLEVTL